MLSAIFTLGVYVGGPVQRRPEALRRDRRLAGRGRVVATVAYYVLPDFSRFDVKLAVVHGIPVSGAYMASAAAYALVYIAALLFGAVAIFSRRDFK